MTPDTLASTDRIERQTLIAAPRAKVWRALTNAREFGTWFGATLEGGTFRPGERVTGPFTIKGHEHKSLDITIEAVHPQDLMSYRWHPDGGQDGVDFADEEPTLVTFTLRDAPGGTLLTVVESGFDQVAPARRLDAVRGNTKGWEFQLRNLTAYATGG